MRLFLLKAFMEEVTQQRPSILPAFPPGTPGGPKQYFGPLPTAANRSKGIMFPPPEERFTVEKSEQLLKIVRARKIRYLTHFTRIKNLKSILQYGILPGSVLSSSPEFAGAQRNLPALPGGWNDAACFNLSFPDYKCFYHMQNHRGMDWAILLIDASVLGKQPFYFFKRSAIETLSSAESAQNEVPAAQRVSAFSAMFSDLSDTPRAPLEIPDSYPTNPQAEILSFRAVTPELIRKVCFCNEYKYNQWVLQNYDFAALQSRNLWEYGMTYFSLRSDYLFWQSRR